MAENKTKPTDASVDAFLDGVVPAQRRDDARRVCDLMAKVANEPPVMWGRAIVGFGNRHYRYASGREGDICQIGFSPRKAATVLYLTCDLDRHQSVLDRLGKHDRGVGCLYVKRMEDVDEHVLEELVTTAWIDR
jgi:hypothetical protein